MLTYNKYLSFYKEILIYMYTDIVKPIHEIESGYKYNRQFKQCILNPCKDISKHEL